ncbi:unnamed protein product, partial [Didymodactylos carnosus]
NKQTFSAEFNVEWFFAAPDGYIRHVLGINRQFPAPVIHVCKGDTIKITVINKIDAPTSIHWHGMFQYGTLTSDGVPGVTQCAIQPGDYYQYKFHTDYQAGTYWYHSHYSVQYIDGLKGALIIHDPKDPWISAYEDEDILMLTDWYHTLALDLEAYYLSPASNGTEPIPDTALINGIGQYNCSLVNKCSYYDTIIQVNTTKRFRIINTSAFAVFVLTIHGHKMRMIEADGVNLDGNIIVDSLRINAGQRYSVLVHANEQNPKRNYWIQATIDSDVMASAPVQPTVKAILRYVDENGCYVSSKKPINSHLNSTDDNLKILDSIHEGDQFIDIYSSLVPLDSPVPQQSTKKVLIEIEFYANDENVNLAHFNNISFLHLMDTTLLSLTRAQQPYPQSNNVQIIQYGDIIDIILNNHDTGEHPIHLHGHIFWILAAGKTNDGDYNSSQVVLNTLNPLARDTASINPISYMVLRFEANNPGLWMMHCHIDWHLQAGLALVWAEAAELLHYKYGLSKELDVCAAY